jgi:hypothetical protein
VDGGDALFKGPTLPLLSLPLARERAEVISAAYGRTLDVFVPGEMDVLDGLDPFLDKVRRHRLPVLAANLVDRVGLRVFPAQAVRRVGALRVLVVGVVSPEVWPVGLALRAVDPVPAIRSAVQSAPPHDAALLVAHATEEEATAWAQAVPVFSLVMSSHTGMLFFQPRTVPLPAGGPVAHSLLFASSKTGKYAARLKARQVGGERTFLGGEERARARFGVENAQRKLEANPANQAARAELARSQAALEAQNLRSHADFDAVGLTDKMADDPVVAAWLARYQARKEALEGAWLTASLPADLPADSPYVGVRACAVCHVEEHRAWSQTPHARAMESLRKKGQAADRQCVGCHTLGFNQPGGFRNPAAPGPLAEVQCESCHDPGRIHAQLGRAGGVGRGSGQATCTKCHDAKNSPSFDYPAARERIRHWVGP